MPHISNQELRLNLRRSDLEIIFKFIPDVVKEAVLPRDKTLANLQAVAEILADILREKRKKRSSILRGKIKPNLWCLVRWGRKPALGKTFLGVLKDIRGEGVLLWTELGTYCVPLWWIQQIYESNELDPVKSWKKNKAPDIAEQHPANTDLKKWREDGFFERLDQSLDKLALASRSFVSEWAASAVSLRERLEGLTEDRLSALYNAVQSMRLEREKDRLERLDIERLPKGSWLEIRPDGNEKSYDAALINRLDENSVAVWLPDDDCIEKIPSYWIKRLKVQKKKVSLDGGLVKHEDRLEHSKVYRAAQVRESSEDVAKTILAKSLRRLDKPLEAWEPLWNEHNRNFHKLVRERGQAVLNWKQRWRDPILPNNHSYLSLEYVQGRPLVVLVILKYVEDDHQHIGDFVRAEINLLDGVVRAKDAAVGNVLRQII